MPLAVEINNLIEEVGITIKHDPSSIITKNQEIVKSYRDALYHKNPIGDQ
jgi:hypothetical protein